MKKRTLKNTNKYPEIRYTVYTDWNNPKAVPGNLHGRDSKGWFYGEI